MAGKLSFGTAVLPLHENVKILGVEMDRGLRDVAAIVVFYKAQVQKVPHLAGLRHLLRVSTRSTRTVLNGGDAVEVP
ncbi:hypothetical protein E2C01_090136 [Portunus trituberculatus]|uniref:Uncharacterized protein n=1 Tax=Portunus trituberculatus TaxID=210409 RepID=A0A5B7JRE1_PORTR|nr:hypothetical protein [Portunus trituberculatus]